MIQPFVQVLFRPEEVIHHSPASVLDPDRFGIEVGDFPTRDFHIDTIAAVGAGVFDFDFLASVSIAVDQQQEVYPSPYAEGLFPGNGRCVEIVAQWAAPLLSVVGQGIPCGLA